jgi:quercetin dioxygenase-like cupin family protein
MEQTDSLKKLQELTDKLPLLTDYIKTRTPGSIEYIVDNIGGTCFGINLFNSGQVAVQRNFISSGTEFKWHRHHVKEILIVYSGEIQVINKQGEVKILRDGDLIAFAIDEGHSAIASEDTWLIAITIPAAASYPQ